MLPVATGGDKIEYKKGKRERMREKKRRALVVMDKKERERHWEYERERKQNGERCEGWKGGGNTGSITSTSIDLYKPHRRPIYSIFLLLPPPPLSSFSLCFCLLHVASFLFS